MSGARVKLPLTIALERGDWDTLLTVLGNAPEKGLLKIYDAIEAAYTDAKRSIQIKTVNRNRDRYRASKLVAPRTVDL